MVYEHDVDPRWMHWGDWAFILGFSMVAPSKTASLHMAEN